MRSSDRKVEKGETENSSTLQLELYKYIPADPHERVDADEVAGEPKIQLRVPGDLRLKNIQGQEKGHRGLGTHLHKEAPPSIFPTDRVQDDGILADLGVADDYEFSLFAHLATTCIFSGSLFLPPVKPLRHRPQSLASVRDFVLLLLRDVEIHRSHQINPIPPPESRNHPSTFHG